MKSRTELRSALSKEFIRELVEELIDAATDFGRTSDELDAETLNLAAQKLYNVVEVLEIEP